jgi:hypothetical protein
MKRIAFGGILTAFLILWQPGSAHLAEERGLTGWKTVKDFKVLKLWEEPSLGPKSPEIAIMQLSAERQKELQSDPLAFYGKYEIFKPSRSDFSKGQFVIQLNEYKSASNDDYFAVAMHDLHTYSGIASFGVDQVVPIK